MRTWSAPDVPSLSVRGPQVRLHDTATGEKHATSPDGPARLYVCGITPYDATHMGHAATYLAFDLLNRAWRSAGHDVLYVQNVTDVDDPLLERANKVDIDWQALAERETQLFREDMEALRVLPPQHYIGAVESIPLVIALIQRLQEQGQIYQVETDLYFRVRSDKRFGAVSGLDEATMRTLFGERGGDPDRPGKEDPLDCVVWRGERPGEPSWPSPFGPGRPGWHIECAGIAQEHLGLGFDVQGGGSDLVFPHHEMSAGEVQVAWPGETFAKLYAHAGMVAYDGEKMSKSLGNLVFVSALRLSDVDPMGIRMALLHHHYRDDWEWTDQGLWAAVDLVDRWRLALAGAGGAPAGSVSAEVLEALADDLDAPRAVAAVDAWVSATLAGDRSDEAAPAEIRRLIDASLGLAL